VYDEGVTYPGTLYYELDKITTIDTVTGKMGLAYPTAKPYSATLPAPYSECPTCIGIPKIVPLANGPIATNITFRNFWYEGDEGFINVNLFDSETETGLYIHSFIVDNSGMARHKLTVGNTIVDDGGPLSMVLGIAAGASGMTDSIISENTYFALHGAAFQWCQESSANILWSHNKITINGTQGTSTSTSSIVQSGVCMGAQFNNNNVEVSHVNNIAVFGWAGSPDFVTAKNNYIHIDKMTDAAGGIGNAINMNDIVESTHVHINNNNWQIDNNLLLIPGFHGPTVLVQGPETEPPDALTTMTEGSGAVNP
jgi:hypothetical protein